MQSVTESPTLSPEMDVSALPVVPFTPEENLKRFMSDHVKVAETMPVQDDYRVRLPVFEGPLDLLLHLIRKEQLNIYDIPVSTICRSYLAQLELMCIPDVNIAGEFFVMAASLLYLKSQVL